MEERKKKKKKCDLGFSVKDGKDFSTWDHSIEHVQYAVICQSLTIDFFINRRDCDGMSLKPFFCKIKDIICHAKGNKKLIKYGIYLNVN
jgi:hypothetical protein